MLARCYNPSHPNHKYYGARGITVDPAWHHFANFARDMGPKPDPKLTLERKRNEDGYSADNCVWATGSDQCVNRRRFRNNTSGATGVTYRNGVFVANFDYERERYLIGRFATLEEAVGVRDAFIGLFFRDRAAAFEMLNYDPLWKLTKTGVRGVTPAADGGYIARVTINGVRTYLGYFKTVEEATAAVLPYRKKKARP